MKKQKLTISTLSLKSFVTTSAIPAKETVKGGVPQSWYPTCLPCNSSSTDDWCTTGPVLC